MRGSNAQSRSPHTSSGSQTAAMRPVWSATRCAAYAHVPRYGAWAQLRRFVFLLLFSSLSRSMHTGKTTQGWVGGRGGCGREGSADWSGQRRRRRRRKRGQRGGWDWWSISWFRFGCARALLSQVQFWAAHAWGTVLGSACVGYSSGQRMRVAMRLFGALQTLVSQRVAKMWCVR
eukprot:1496912-Rhodomonas_salina.1